MSVVHNPKVGALAEESDWLAEHVVDIPTVVLGNTETTYTSGTVGLLGLGNVTVRSTTGQQFQISVPAQSVQAETQTFVGGIAMNAATTYTSGTVVLSAGANITLGSNAQTITISGVAAQTVQTQNLVAISASNNLFSSGTVTISGFGDVTVNTAAGLIRISAPVQTAQTGISALYDGANSISSGTVRFTNANGVSFSVNGNTVSGSVAAGATATGNLGAIAINALTTYTSGTVVLSDSNGVTFGTNAQTVTASVNQSISMFAVSNTTQSSSGTAHKSALSFAGAGIASVGVTGGSVVISVPSGGGAGDGGVFAGVSTGGNTAGSTGTVSTGNLVLVGSNGITLSQSTGAAGSAATITIVGPAVTFSGYNPYGSIERVAGQIGQGTLNFDPMRIDTPFQFDRILMPIANTNSSNSSGSHTLSFWVGVYTRNVSSISRLYSTSGSTALTHSGTAGSYSLYSGIRLFSIPATSTFSAGQYWIGVVSRTTSGGANGSYSQMVLSNVASNFMGFFGSSHNTTYQLTLGQGVYTATTSAIPNAVAFSEIRGSDSMVLRAPMVMFGSGTVP